MVVYVLYSVGQASDILIIFYYCAYSWKNPKILKFNTFNKNPHWINEEAYGYHPQKLNIWMGNIEKRFIGPFLIDGNLTWLISFIKNLIIPAPQQDGGSSYDRRVGDSLDVNFQNRWIRRKGFVEWPNSPNLNPLNFFFKVI